MDLFNYAAKGALVPKIDLAGLKTKLDNLDKLKIVSADLSKLSVVHNDVKKTVYDKLVTKINAIDTKIPSTIGLFTETQYYSNSQGLAKRIADIDKKILNDSGLIKDIDSD